MLLRIFTKMVTFLKPSFRNYFRALETLTFHFVPFKVLVFINSYCTPHITEGFKNTSTVAVKKLVAGTCTVVVKLNGNLTLNAVKLFKMCSSISPLGTSHLNPLHLPSFANFMP